MSEITNIKQSILSDITGQEYINRRNFLESPIMWWENEQTQLNATNLNKMSRAIKNVQDEFSTESNNVQSILADVVSNIAGWSSTENNTAEIFNDYQNNKELQIIHQLKVLILLQAKFINIQMVIRKRLEKPLLLKELELFQPPIINMYKVDGTY